MSDNTVTIIVAIIGTGVLNTIVNSIISSIAKKKDKTNSDNNSLRVIMKTVIRILCKQYVSQGWIYADELEDLIEMHDCYHNDLHGNGYLDELMNRVKNLEIRGLEVR